MSPFEIRCWGLLLLFCVCGGGAFKKKNRGKVKTIAKGYDSQTRERSMNFGEGKDYSPEK